MRCGPFGALGFRAVLVTPFRVVLIALAVFGPFGARAVLLLVLEWGLMMLGSLGVFGMKGTGRLLSYLPGSGGPSSRVDGGIRGVGFVHRGVGAHILAFVVPRSLALHWQPPSRGIRPSVRVRVLGVLAHWG